MTHKTVAQRVASEVDGLPAAARFRSLRNHCFDQEIRLRIDLSIRGWRPLPLRSARTGSHECY
jgi:hypothetical protein